MRIDAILLPSSDFSVAHSMMTSLLNVKESF